MQNVMPKPIFSTVRQRVDIIEANLRNQSAPHNPGRDFQDEETTGELMGEPDWRAEVSSDMSTTPLSSSWPNHFQRLGTKSQAVSVLTEAGLADSPSFQDGITTAIPNIQDLLAADARTPESELDWNPKKIDWSAQQSTRQALVCLAFPKLFLIQFEHVFMSSQMFSLTREVGSELTLFRWFRETKKVCVSQN